MLILDKTRALNMILWNSERISVPQQFLMGVSEAGEEAGASAPELIRPRVVAIYEPMARAG